MNDEKKTPEDSRRPKVVFYSFLILLFFIFFLAFLVFRHFLVTVAVSASVAALLGPVYDRLTRALRGQRSLSAALMVALTTVVILVPLLTYAILLSSQAVDFYEWIRPQLEVAALRQLWTQDLPARYPWVLRVQEAFQLTDLDQSAFDGAHLTGAQPVCVGSESHHTRGSDWGYFGCTLSNTVSHYAFFHSA